MIKKGAPVDIIKTKRDLNGQILLTEIKTENYVLAIINIYAPNVDCPQFFSDLATYMECLPEVKIVAGDFNIVMNEDLDRYTGCTQEKNIQKKRSYDTLTALMEQYKLCDVWRERNLTKKRYSWFKNQHDSMANKKSITAIYEELERFKYQSGFTVSYEKTTLYRIGSLRHSNAQLYDLDQFAWSNNDINVLGVTIAHEDIVMKNYNAIIDKVKTTLNAWFNRGLSLMGKVQVVNTLIASLFVYKMMVLPPIPDGIVKKVDCEIRKFLWGGKKSKIAYNILQNPKKEGGLGLVNLRKKDVALKATWPQILYDEKDYSVVVYHLLRCDTIGEDLWRCTIHPEDVSTLGCKSDFWASVITSWSQFNRFYSFRVENQLLWYNSFIKVKGRIVMWKDCYVRGLRYVHQLFENQKFKEDWRVWEEYGLTQLRYNSLKCAIPKEWRDFFQEHQKSLFFPLPPHNFDVVIQDQYKGLSNTVYKFISEDVLLIHNKYIKWREEIGECLCESLWDYGLEHIYLLVLR